MNSIRYKATARASLVAMVLGLAACAGDPGADGKDGSSCTIKDNTDGSKTLTCTDGKTVDIKSGAPGKDGSSCVASEAAGKKTITCSDGSKVTVTDGAAGKDGAAGAAGAAGANGKSCTVKDNGNGTKTLSCEDGTTVTVADGQAGKNGETCKVTDEGKGAKAINCPGSPTVTVNDGKSCSVKDNGNGTKTISCEDGTTVTVNDGKEGAAGAAGKSCTVKDNGDGTKTLNCADGTSATVNDGAAGAAGLSTASLGLNIEVKSITTVATDPIKVTFTMKDDYGYPIDVCGKYSLNTVITPRFGLMYHTKDAAGNVLPYTVLTKSTSTSAPTVANPTVFSPLGSDCKQVTTGQGTFAQVSQGTYAYTFPTANATPTGAQKVAYDAAKLDETHTLWIQAARQVDINNTQATETFKAVDKEYNFIPSGKGTPQRREITATASCNNCHRGFKPEGTVSGTFHGAGRVEAPYCNTCHNDRKTSTGAANEAADSMVFVHRLHNSDEINPANLFYAIKFAFPQDIRNCKSCHAGSQQPDQWKTRPTRKACTSCHDRTDLTTSTLVKCITPAAVDANGVAIPCQHPAGPQPDTSCTLCHTPTNIADSHQTVVPPDPNNAFTKPVGGSNNTHAAFMAAANFVPANAEVITYDLKEVTTFNDGTVRRPQMTFKFKKGAADVVFQTYAAGTVTEMIPNFIGAPSAYFVFAVPQDGIAMPADFNASTSVYLKSAWNGATTDIKTGTWTLGTQGTNTCSTSTPCTCGDGLNNNPAVCKVPLATLSFDAATGYYTVKLNTVMIPPTATMLTGGLGYSYSLASSQPLTQINLPAYPYNATTKVGGLLVPAPNVWLPAKNTNVTTGQATTGYQGTQLCAQKTCDCSTTKPCVQWAPRRTIVDNAACNKCHAQLGAAPSFHAGQRNNGPSCSWCHNPNRTSAAWSANAKDFVHAVHGARKRTVPFTWRALSETQSFAEVEFPGPVSNCAACHTAGAFDFSATASKNALPNMLPSTVGQGKYNADPLTNSTYYTLSPYVIADNTQDYGTGFSFSAATGITAEAKDTTLIVSPITAACSGCHDSAVAIDHMQASGGRFYDTRANAKAPGAVKEQCMLCHGPGKVAAIANVHK